LEPIPSTVEPSSAPFPNDLRQNVLGAFRGRIAPVPLPPHYRLALSAVALGMVMLPLLYGSLLGLVGLGIYDYLSAVPLPVVRGSGRAMLAAWMLYMAPVVAGGLVLVFLVKPLFARAAEAGRPRVLRRDQEPLLFEFVERVCRSVGAPLPRRIYVDASVNANASLRRGLLSLVGEDDLVLTIGLPLAAGLSLQQMAGVLAHELAHFAQRAGMRLSYVVRSTNFWFARVVFQPDAWDDWLRREASRSDNLLLGLVLLLSRGCIWLTRRVLLGLMWAGHVISCFMMRQMEFDADRYEARLVGSPTFEATMRDLRLLDLSHQKSLADLEASWREHRLADSLPSLTLANRERMPEKVRHEVARHVQEEKTKLFSTHPADEERCANVRRERGQPVFQSDLPAAALFRDFTALARAVTLDYYREVLGDAVRSEKLVPVDEVVTRQERSSQESEALSRYFQEALSMLRPVTLSGASPVAREAGPAETLRAARQEAERSLPELARGSERYQKAFFRLISVRQAEALLEAGFKVQPGDFALPGSDPGAIRRARETTGARLRTADEDLSPHERACGTRLLSALQLLEDGSVAAQADPAGELRAQLPRLLETASLLGALFRQLRDLHATRAEVAVLVRQLEEHQQSPKLQEGLRSREERLKAQLNSLHGLLAGVAYPFDHADSTVTLQSYAFMTPPDGQRLFDLYALSDQVLDRLYEVYYRLLGRLAWTAERAEAAVGLEPLPRPEPGQEVAQGGGKDASPGPGSARKAIH
jgi:Zn-dependent protease with chaperone function